MKTNGKYEVIARIAGPGLVLGAVFALVLSGSCVGRAQSSATSPAVPAATHAKAVPSAQAVHSVAPAKRQPGGTHEGFKVHGHWVIEVKNPDGTVTARREFENSVQTSGMAYLASLLAGNNSPGGLSVLLNGQGTSFSLSGANQTAGFVNALSFPVSASGPCTPLTYSVTLGNTALSADSGGPSSGTTCLLTTGVSSSGFLSSLGLYCYDAQSNNNTTSPASGLTQPCSTNLTVSAPTVNSEFTQSSPSAVEIQIMGSVTVTSTAAGSVTDVETVFTTCTAAATPGNCVGANPATMATIATGPVTYPIAYNFLTERTLNGPTGSSTAPVAYSPGQIINVQVTISFQ
jgi:hypothetical protein